MKLIMTKIATTLLEDIESSFFEISNKLDEYRVKLKSSMSEFETDKYVENLIKSQRMLKKRALDIEKYLDALIEKYY
jgi:hypothetical protein